MVRLCLFFLLVLSACSVRSPQSLDQAKPAADSRDYTVILEGCGQGPQAGYLFCRVTEGSLPTDEIKMYFPAVDCRRENCVDWQLIQPSGNYGARGSLPARATRVSIPLSKIIQDSKKVTVEHDDEYLVASRIWYLTDTDEEFSIKGYGVIRIRVLSENYTRLACGDPELAWIQKISSTCQAHFSTQYRSALCCEGDSWK